MTAHRSGEKASESPTAGSEEGERQPSASPSSEHAPINDKKKGALITSEPPLPDEEAPPLPDESAPKDDGWSYHWDYNAGAYFFENRFTGQKQWNNPRVPDGIENAYNGSSTTRSDPLPTTSSGAPGTSSSPPRRRWGGYNPAIHGNYDPNADYALEAQKEEEEAEAAAAAAATGLAYPNQDYSVQANFNRFTGKFQQTGMGPDMHNDENKSRRQMNAFFDVDAAANSHDGRSLKAERRGKTLTKDEVRAFRAKRHQKKEEKRRAWLRE